MSFKYYDILSSLVVGIVAICAIWSLFFPDLEISEWVILPAGYVMGYFLNAVSSFVEPALYKLIFGKPSDRLLTLVPGQKWTGIKKVKFYFAEQAIESLRKDIGDDHAPTDKMFSYAMRMVNANNNCRVPDLNGHYALSRVILISVIIAVVVLEVRCYSVWYTWLISLVALFFAWNRYREQGYYYAREVLNEYLNLK